MDHINRILDQLDRETEGIAYVEQAAQKFHTRRAYIALGAALLAFVFFFLGFGAPLLCHVIGTMYPAYASFRAIESKGAEDVTQWLMYWVIFAFFNLCETLIDRILFWFPFYYAAKIAFLLYCQLPVFHGAQFLYNQFAGPWFRKNRPAIDAQFARLGGATSAFREAIESATRPVAPAAASTAHGGDAAVLDPANLFRSGPVQRQRAPAEGKQQ